MGFYINMEMPTAPVLFCIHPDGKVFADLEGGWREYKVIPFPPHGRLIDADALEKEAQKRMLMCNKNDNQFQKPYEIMRAIALAPTIIPASGGNEGVEHTMDEFMYGQEGNPNDGSM